MKFHLFLFASVLSLMSCEKNALGTDAQSAERPFVEAYLQPGIQPLVLVRNQLLYGSSDTVQRPVEGLSISIRDTATGVVYPLVHTDSSAYIGEGWQPESGKVYQLYFEYHGNQVQALTQIPAKPSGFAASVTSIKAFDPSDFTPGGGGTPPAFQDPIELSWDAETGHYYLLVVETAEDDPELIFSDTTEFRPFRAFRSEPAQTNVQQLQVMSFRYYGLHRVMLYHLNAEYAALYESYGTNSTNLTTPYTNVDNGLGIFTGVNADTILINVTH